MKLVTLHLTDIHISSSGDPILSVAEKIGRAAFSSLVDADALVIAVSGDIAYSGQPEQYEAALKFLNEVRVTIENEYKSLPVYFVVAPGNHDCNLQGDQTDRTEVIEKIVPGRVSNGRELSGILDICVSVQNEFFAFKEKLTGNKPNDRLWDSLRFEVGGVSVVFDAINLSWTSQKHELVGKIYFPMKLYDNKIQKDCDLRIAVLHHPAHWLAQTIYRDFRTFIRKLANLVITGHEHEQNSGVNDDDESGRTAFVEGDVLQRDSSSSGMDDTGFSIITISGDKCETFVTQKFDWNKATKIYQPSAPISRQIPPINRNDFQITSSFLSVLDDVMVPNSQATRVLRLSDIFEFPMLRTLDGADVTNLQFYNSELLENPENSKKVLILLGGDSAGKTSLLYQLFRRLHDNGAIPVYIDGSRLRHTDTAELQKLVNTAVEQQYGPEAVVRFQQTGKERKRLLLDNVDDSPIRNSKNRARALRRLSSLFAGSIVTAPPEFVVREVLADEVDEGDFAVTQFRLEPFGHTLRSRLVRRWVESHTDDSMDDDEILDKRDAAEKLLTEVMGHSVVPSLPIYLVTLLQSLDVGKEHTLRGAGLGHYYSYLLTESFLAAGAQEQKLSEQYTYAAALAWHFHTSKTNAISTESFFKFNEEFSRDWVGTDGRERLEFLIRAKVLKHEGDQISFRYEYIYYLMKAMYMHDHRADDHIRSHIEECCGALDDRDNAHTILFLSHYSVDDYLLDNIIAANQKAFADEPEIRFHEDIQSVKQLILDAPKLVLPTSTPEENRREVHERRDKFERDRESNGEHDDKLSRSDKNLSVLFKTSEIMGHLLKAQYSRITRKRKAELIKEIFKGPMRGVSFVYNFLNKMPAVLRSTLEEAGAEYAEGNRNNDRHKERIVRQAVSLLIEVITLVFINRAADSARSDDIADDIRMVIEDDKNNNAYTLIDVAISLDQQRPLPRQKLDDAQKKFAGNVIAQRLLQWLVLNRLMMFNTSSSDLDWAVHQFELNEPAVRTLSNQSQAALAGEAKASPFIESDTPT